MADDSQKIVEDVEQHTMESNEQQPPPEESIETPHTSKTEKRGFHEAFPSYIMELEKIVDKLKATKILQTEGATTDHGEPSVSGVFGLRSQAGAYQETTDSDNESSSEWWEIVKMMNKKESFSNLSSETSCGKQPGSFTPISDEDSRTGSSETELSILSDLSDDSDVDERC